MKLGQILSWLEENDAPCKAEVKDVLSAFQDKKVDKTQAGILTRLHGALESKDARNVRQIIQEIRVSTKQKTEPISENPNLPRLPKPPDITSEMARAFSASCGGNISRDDSLKRRIKLGDVEYEDTVSALLCRVGKTIFGSAEERSKAKKYLFFLANGKNHTEALSEVEKNLALKLPTIPAPPGMTAAMAKAIIETSADHFSSTNSTRQKFVVGKKEYEDSLNAILVRIGFFIVLEYARARYQEANVLSFGQHLDERMPGLFAFPEYRAGTLALAKEMDS